MRKARTRTPSELRSPAERYREIWVRTYRALSPTRGLQREWGDGALLLAIYASCDLNLAREQTKLVESLTELEELRSQELASWRRHRELRARIRRQEATATWMFQNCLPHRWRVAFAPRAPAAKAD